MEWNQNEFVDSAHNIEIKPKLYFKDSVANVFFYCSMHSKDIEKGAKKPRLGTVKKQLKKWRGEYNASVRHDINLLKRMDKAYKKWDKLFEKELKKAVLKTIDKIK